MRKAALPDGFSHGGTVAVTKLFTFAATAFGSIQNLSHIFLRVAIGLVLFALLLRR